MADETVPQSLRENLPRPFSGILAVAILIFLLGITFFVWNDARYDAASGEYAEFQNDAKEITAAIDKRMNGYANMIRGVSGLFSASESVDRDEFHAYIELIDLKKKLSGRDQSQFRGIYQRREQSGV